MDPSHLFTPPRLLLLLQQQQQQEPTTHCHARKGVFFFFVEREWFWTRDMQNQTVMDPQFCGEERLFL